MRIHLSRLPIRQHRRDVLSRRSPSSPPPGQVEYLTLDAVAIPAQNPTDAPGLVIVVEAGVVILQRNITQKAHISLQFHQFCARRRDILGLEPHGLLVLD